MSGVMRTALRFAQPEPDQARGRRPTKGISCVNPSRANVWSPSETSDAIRLRAGRSPLGGGSFAGCSERKAHRRLLTTNPYAASDGGPRAAGGLCGCRDSCSLDAQKGTVLSRWALGPRSPTPGERIREEIGVKVPTGGSLTERARDRRDGGPELESEGFESLWVRTTSCYRTEIESRYPFARTCATTGATDHPILDAVMRWRYRRGDRARGRSARPCSCCRARPVRLREAGASIDMARATVFGRSRRGAGSRESSNALSAHSQPGGTRGSTMDLVNP